MGEKRGESWVLVLFKYLKKNFKRLQNCSWKKNRTRKLKKWKKWNIDFRQKKHLEVVFSTSSAKKWFFWKILKLFCSGKFFHRTNSFCSTSAWKYYFFDFFFKIWCFFVKNMKNGPNEEFSNQLREANFKYFWSREKPEES